MNNKLGHTYEDKITGFKGIAIGHCEYLTGCNQTLLSSKCNDNKKSSESNWFDDQRLELLVDVKKLKLENEETPGFCEPAPLK